MNKLIIVEDNHIFRKTVENVVKNNFPKCNIFMFIEDTKAMEAISSTEKDFDVLLLDGDLGVGGSGGNVLNILTLEQLEKTIICSGNDDFIAEAKKKGVSILIDKGFAGIRASKIVPYILETFGKITG